MAKLKNINELKKMIQDGEKSITYTSNKGDTLTVVFKEPRNSIIDKIHQNLNVYSYFITKEEKASNIDILKISLILAIVELTDMNYIDFSKNIPTQLEKLAELGEILTDIVLEDDDTTLFGAIIEELSKNGSLEKVTNGLRKYNEKTKEILEKVSEELEEQESVEE